MPSEESIRTDASTVHRSPKSVPSLENAPTHRSTPAAGSDRGSEADQIAQAQTVIRGSSHDENSGKPASQQVNRTPAAVAAVLLGQRLNHFLLEELIGGGGMGAVFRAHDDRLDRTVAVKVIPFVGDDPDLRRRFRNEAQSAAKLDHPRIARVFDTGSHGEWHYIVFEYIQGTNIRDLIASDGVMSVDEAVYYTSQLAGALQHAADRGIVHRDIKPSNVLIGSEGKIKLVDMGLARSENIELTEDMTASGVTLGTFDYISPEQAQDPRDADLRSDIYSLGCTLYFMLTGRPPYPGGTMLQKLLSHGKAPPPDVRELRPEVSQNLVAVINKMLAKDPADRYQSATDLIADLREVAFRDGLIRSQALGPVTIAHPNAFGVWLEKHAPWIAAAALLIASAGWLHLESAASRDLVVPPRSAQTPRPSIAPPAYDTSGPPFAAVPKWQRPPEPERNEIARDATGTTEPPPAYGDPEDPPTLELVPVPGAVAPSAAASSAPPVAPLRDETFQVGTLPDGSAPLMDDANQDASPQAPRVPNPNLIRIAGPSEEDFDPVDGAALAMSLQQALELAQQYGSREIEVAVPVLHSPPVSVNVDDLRIRSKISGSMIVLEPPDSVTADRSTMFSIGSHAIEFEDIHFVWTASDGELTGGALFEINDNPLVRLTDCSVTVRNPAERGSVYVFDVITDPDGLRVDRRGPITDLPLVRLELDNVVIRGPMTMLHMDDAARLALSWDNGLLAVSERMIDTGGARRPPTPEQKISLSFTRVTVHAPAGIVRMRVGGDSAYPMPIERLARRSLFLVDPSMPHFEISGLSSLQESSPMLQLSGSSNAYPVDAALDEPMLRLRTTNGLSESTRMSDLRTSAPSWVSETKPDWSVNWASATAFSGVPPSQRLPADYRQMGASPPGCDEKSLPTMEDLIDGENDGSNLRSDLRGGAKIAER